MSVGIRSLRPWAVALSTVFVLAACTPGSVERAAHTGDLDGGDLSIAAASTAGMPGFGEIVPVCGVKGRELGQRVDRLPAKGRETWALYDTQPGSSAPRAFHVTGFKDGCARRVTAALAMFGSVELYEMVRMSGLAETPEADTDRVYAELRRGPCGAARTPCTGSGLNALSKRTGFLTVFPRKASADYLEVLLHKGELAAIAQK